MKIQEEESEKFQQWVLDKTKEKLEKNNTRHPVMTTIKKFADKKIIEYYKLYGLNLDNKIDNFEKKLSVFEVDYYKPSSFDKILFNLRKLQLEQKLKIFKEKTLHYLYQTKTFFSTYYNLIDENFSKVYQNNNEGTKIIKNSKLTNFITKRFNPQASIKDPLELILFEKEKMNKEFEMKISINRISNFWRKVCNVKPNYLIEIKAPKPKLISSKNYQTIFFKIYKICIPNLSFKFKFNFRKASKYLLIFFILSFLLQNFKIRYSNYNKYQEYQENEQFINFIDENTKKGKKILTIFDEVTDKKFLDILKKENELMNITDEKLVEDIKNKDQLKADFFNEILYISIFSANLYYLKLLGPLFYSLYLYIYKYKIKKVIPGKVHILKKFFLWFLILNEFSFYMTYQSFIRQRNFASFYILEGDYAEIIKYQFFRNNIHHCYLANY